MPPPFDFCDHSDDNRYRYTLGTRGNRTLFCLGVNPSTADANNSDTTITKVENVVHRRGRAKDICFGGNFDSFMMLNIYPLRATNPDGLPETIDRVTESCEHKKNVKHILRLVPDNSVIWAAWGNLVQSRDWLEECLYGIIDEVQGNRRNIRWVKMGNLTVQGEPPHPARVKYQPFTPYDVNARRRR